MIGSTGIYIAFLAGSVATLLYLYSAVKDDPGVLRVSHFAFFVHTTGIVVASVYLLYALLGHKFQYYYVYAYTERALELRYIISAFWAGQEGTLLLWALIAALIGMVLLFRERELLAPVMTFLCAGQLFLLFFLVVENPFRLLPQMPADGAGLNPLLLDPWMTLHPPVVFAGYALFFVPYAYAAAGLWKNDYMGWAKKALPWSLAGWFFLSVGIFIGGYWAYRVLGWGGYWSWDPVENASLIPWLTGAALIHGLLLQKKLNRMLISNALFAIVTYVLIIYATFLTRSGVLTDFSVHSFAETPLKNYLAAFLFLFLLVGFGLFTIRFINFKKHGQGNPLTFSISLYWLFAGGIILLLGMAGFIALGTSSPLITSLLGAPASVDESFYVRTSTPLAVLLLLLLGLAPYLSWQERPASSVLYDAMPAGLGGLAGVVTALFAGIREPYALVFVFAAVFALFAALGGLYSALRRKRLRLSGAYLAHAGVAMLLIGMLFSMGYTSNEVVSLSEGGSSQALGYQVSYVQRIDEQNEGHQSGDQCESCDYTGQDRDIFQLDIEQGREHFTAHLQMYTAGREERLMREPFIRRFWWGDLYLSPLEVQQRRQGMVLDFKVGNRYNVRNMEVYFAGFEIPNHGEELEVGARLNISYAGEEYSLMPVTYQEDNQWESQLEATPDGGRVMLEHFDPDAGSVHLRFISPYEDFGVREVLFVELSRKPFISVLAAGTVLIMAGIFIAAWRRFAETAGKAGGSDDRI